MKTDRAEVAFDVNLMRPTPPSRAHVTLTHHRNVYTGAVRYEVGATESNPRHHPGDEWTAIHRFPFLWLARWRAAARAKHYGWLVDEVTFTEVTDDV